MQKRRRIGLKITIVLAVAFLAILGWFLKGIFEGESPRIDVEPSPEYISGSVEFTVTVADKERGLRRLKATVGQEGREITVFERDFDFQGLLNREGIHTFRARFSLDPLELQLAQGRADLTVQAWDYSRRSGGDGNHAVVRQKIVVDTIPPAIRAVSRMHNVNQGGAGLVVYRASSDIVNSGVYIDGEFFSGFSVEKASGSGFHVCYFAVPVDKGAEPEAYLWAKDRAGNETKGSFYYLVRKRRFATEKMRITDRFLERILPYFSPYLGNQEGSPIERFLKVNRSLRQENNVTCRELSRRTGANRLWEGTWLRLKNAATMSRFGERRLYYYEGDKVDEQFHMGVDLASLAHSEVQAANHGRVLFADRLGIYGQTVVLDHGQGLASMYGHLSSIDVRCEEEVTKGQVIGYTGQTGLAGGDHLHFGVMVNGCFVNPVEWWDPHWIHDNITRKLELLKE